MHNLIFRFIIEISQSTELSGTVQCITVGHSVLSTHIQPQRISQCTVYTHAVTVHSVFHRVMSTHIQSQFTVYFTEYCLHTFSHGVFHRNTKNIFKSVKISESSSQIQRGTFSIH